MTLTLAEQYAEYQHIVSNRIGSLAEDRKPTPEQIAIGELEAQEWQRRYLAENPRDGQRELL